MDPRQGLTLALPTVVFAAYLFTYDAWDLATLFCLSVLSVSVGRALQEVYQDWRLGWPAHVTGRYRSRPVLMSLAMVAAVVVLCLVSPATLWLVAEHWYLALTAPMLALASQLGGTPRAELMDALRVTKTSYSEGAAWIFFLGYLEIIFGEHGLPFEKRMRDYISSNQIRGESERYTYCRRMFILVPMRRAAMLSEKDFHENDASVTKERALRSAATVNGRKYGETSVYQVVQDGRPYRLAMELASPLRTAGQTVEDAQVDFSDADFEEFARRFLPKLQEILQSKPAIGRQLELVKFDSADQLGRAVVERLRALRELEGEPAEPELLTARLEEAGSLAATGSTASPARLPEESSELEFGRIDSLSAVDPPAAPGAYDD